MEKDEVILLDFWPSMFGMRLRIALAEKGIDYEHKEEDLINNKSPLLLEMNPIYKKVPVLIHYGKPVCESLVALEYIDEVWKDKGSPLLPSDPYEKAQARFWTDYIDKKWESQSFGRKMLWSTKEEDIEATKKDFIESLKLLEQVLGEKVYFGGEAIGFLDIAMLGYYAWFYVFETYGNFNIEAECPKIIAWGKRCMKKESVSKSLPNPHKICEYLQGLRKRFGID